MMNPRIIDGLSKISKKIWDKGREVVILCPYCDDSNRPKASSHGHCYISKDRLLFHCFRCDTSGSLLKLFTDFGIDDGLDSVRNYSSGEIYGVIVNNKKLNIPRVNISDEHYNIFINYIIERIGISNHEQFLIFPRVSHNKVYCVFYNYDGVEVNVRSIQDTKIRYITSTPNSLYYFQNLDQEYKQITIAEGAFDIINLYLYNNEFTDSLFVAAGGKRYVSVAERLVNSNFLIGEYRLNIVFDSDVDISRFTRVMNRTIKSLNPEISINYYLPIIGKDCGDFPHVKKIDYAEGEVS